MFPWNGPLLPEIIKDVVTENQGDIPIHTDASWPNVIDAPLT